MSKQDGLWADDFAERLLHPNEVIFCIFKLLFFNSTKPEVGIEKSGGVWTDVFVQSDLSVRCDHSDSRQRETCGRINKFALLFSNVSMFFAHRRCRPTSTAAMSRGTSAVDMSFVYRNRWRACKEAGSDSVNT